MGSDHLNLRYSTNDRMLNFKRIRSNFLMDTFQVITKAVNELGNRYMQLFVSDEGYMYVHPMKAITEIIDSVKAFAKEIGVPTGFILDLCGEQRSKELNRVTEEMCYPIKYLESSSQWGN